MDDRRAPMDPDDVDGHFAEVLGCEDQEPIHVTVPGSGDDPRIDASSPGWQLGPIPPASDYNTARLIALRHRALVLTLYCSGLRREEATRTAKARGAHECAAR